MTEHIYVETIIYTETEKNVILEDCHETFGLLRLNYLFKMIRTLD